MDASADSPVLLPFAIIGGFLIVFPLFWSFVLWILSSVGGWSSLAKHYAAGEKALTGEAHRLVTGMVGGVSYRHVLNVRVSQEGFFVEPIALFRVCHPRLFIPWRDVTARTPVSVLWWKSMRLSIGLPNVGSITLPTEVLSHQPHAAAP